MSGMPGLVEEGVFYWPGHSQRKKGEQMWGVVGGMAFAGVFALMFERSGRRSRRRG